MLKTLSSTLIPLLLLGHLLPAIPASAQEETGTITINQSSDSGVLGEWVLIRPGNKRLSLQKDTHTIDNATLGNYTLLVETPPSGTTTTINAYIDDDVLEAVERKQYSFTLEQNMNLRLDLEYTLTRFGTVSVNSSPPGIGFSLEGPDEIISTGNTPGSFENMPEGLYTVTYDKLEDCATPKPQSDRLEAGSRINLSITISCENLDKMVQTQDYQKQIEYVSSVIDGKTVVFEDVSVSAWFAPYVHNTLKTGIVSGYKNDQGELTGRYGPGDSVTIAQLTKIAHELAGIDEKSARGAPQNIRAKNEWFSTYFASAEQRDWLMFRDPRLDPFRPATRAEVIATLLQALDVPRLWAKGDLFTDVKATTPYAASIETAAIDGLVGGFTDANGNETGRFGPDQPINRAETAKIVSLAIDLYGSIDL